MNRIAPAAILATLLAAGPGPASADVSLAEASAYLNGFTGAEGKFTQIADDGSIATGTVRLQRPGRMRFEYDPPLEQLVVAGGGQVAVFDGKSNAGPEQYPLSRTPLSIILAPQVDLTRARMVTGRRVDGPSTTITAQDPENPDYGSIDLVFTDDPVELRQWVVRDASGGATTVVLGELTLGAGFPSSNFSIPIETERWRR